MVRVGGEICSPHPAQKVHALLGLLYKSSNVMGLGQFVCYLHPQELDAFDYLHCFVVDKEWSVTGLASPEVNDDFLGFFNIQG